MLRSILLASLCLFGASPLVGSSVGPASEAVVPTGSIEGALCSLKKVRSRGTTSEADLVVWLEREGAEVARVSADTEVEVQQIKREFLPHVLCVQAGTKVRFQNSDSIRHNILANDGCCKVDADLEKGDDFEQVFGEPGVSSILCRLHPEMAMFVVVSPTPHFAKARLERKKNDAGERVYLSKYKLDAVPEGKYTLHVWSKKLERREVKVEVKAGETLKVDVDW